MPEEDVSYSIILSLTPLRPTGSLFLSQQAQWSCLYLDDTGLTGTYVVTVVVVVVFFFNLVPRDLNSGPKTHSASSLHS